MNEKQALVSGYKAPHQVPIFSIIRCNHDAHAAGAINHQKSPKTRVFNPNHVESLPCEECDDVIFQMSEGIVRADGAFGSAAQPKLTESR
jgi:hypothetical protein